jgi:hypothetical protein
MTRSSLNHSVDKAMIAGFASACLMDAGDYIRAGFFMAIALVILARVVYLEIGSR